MKMMLGLLRNRTNKEIQLGIGQKPYGDQIGFGDWYILQHWTNYNGVYKPFTTVIEFDVDISGTIN